MCGVYSPGQTSAPLCLDAEEGIQGLASAGSGLCPGATFPSSMNFWIPSAVDLFVFEHLLSPPSPTPLLLLMLGKELRVAGPCALPLINAHHQWPNASVFDVYF